MDVIKDYYNTFLGTIIAMLSMLFGDHWFLFTMFIVLNVVDWLTGWMKSRLMKRENSAAGWYGVLKKLGYWAMILVAFLTSVGFVEIGNVLGMDLGVTVLLGWFVLASLIVNEIRSIIENFVEAGFQVPKVLIKGLEIADQMINKEESEEK